MSPADQPFYIPASTPAEAIARIYSLTGARDSGTRGEKRAIVALRDALRLDIDLARTSVVMGQQISAALGVEWLPSYENVNMVNLDGLNALLEGATEAYHQGSLRRLAEHRPESLSDPKWADFQPARSKIEAVNRISMLTNSGPEWLGPGSKEHKRVLLNLNQGLHLDLDSRLSKTKLGRALANEFGAPWTDACESTGETISLIGLNTILAGAELRFGRFGSDLAMLFGTPEEEGRALAAALLDAFRPTTFADKSKRVHWDGRRCVKWLADNETGDQNQMEWPGFFWEHRARTILNTVFAPNPNPPRIKYGPKPFDYSLNFVWDLKSHTESWLDPATGIMTSGQSGAPLNDAQSMDECIADQGLGFLMVGGTAIADAGGAFKAWHDKFKGKAAAPSNSGASRRRKAAFEPLHVDAYWFANLEAFGAAKVAGHILGFKQGKQAPGRIGQAGVDRRPKYNLSKSAAGQGIHVARYDYPRSEAKA